MYWFLWYHNLLIAGLALRGLYGLLRRKYLMYPSLEELRSSRRWQDQADAFSKSIIVRLAMAPAPSVMTVWNGIRRKMRKGEDAKDAKLAEEPSGIVAASAVPNIIVEDFTEDVDATGLRTEDVPLADSDLAGPLLDVANQIADFHERIRKCVTFRISH